MIRRPPRSTQVRTLFPYTTLFRSTCTSPCLQTITYTPQTCSHVNQRRCYEPEQTVKCQQRCERDLPCGHRCTERCCFPCTDPQQRQACLVKVTFQHKCPYKHSDTKQCFEDGDKIPCRAVVPFKFPACGHEGTRECNKQPTDYQCQAPCSRMLSCGANHPCKQKCHETCDVTRCDVCRKKREIEAKQKLEQEKRAREEAKTAAFFELERYRERYRGSEGLFDRRRLSEHGDGAQEYFNVSDRVLKYVQATHNWMPSVRMIEKVVNVRLKIRWLEAKAELRAPEEPRLLFHGTDAADAIVKEGFRVGGAGMYGAGIYFATDSSKSAQHIYTKGSNQLLLCDVLLGRSKTVSTAQGHITLDRIRGEGYDSLYAKRDTKNTGGVLFDEFVVYDPRQAFPKYIVHYDVTAFGAHVPVPRSLFGGVGPTKKTTIAPSRTIDATDPLQMHFRIAESQFLRLKNRGVRVGDITHVDYYENPRLIKLFDQAKRAFKLKYPGRQEGEPVLAFHGTSAANIPKIMEENFRMDKISRGAHGWGIYFSEFPDVSEGYASGGRCLLLCYLLPGKSYQGAGGNSQLQPGYDSHIVAPDQQGRAQMIVIFRPEQILPTYVIHYN